MVQLNPSGITVLISSASIGFANVIADHLLRRPQVAEVHVPADVEATLALLAKNAFDMHLVGGASLDYVRRSRKEALGTGRVFNDSGELVLMMNEPEPFRALLAMDWGFSRSIDMRLAMDDIVDRILAPVGSDPWTEDLLENFPVGDGKDAPRMSAIFRDKIDVAIIEGILEGLSDPEIAERINYAVQSVRNRVSRILMAARCRNRTHFAVRMMQVRPTRQTGT